MRTIRIKAYKFNELSTSAKQTAIEDYRKSQWDFGDVLDFFNEDCFEQISSEGFENPKVYYSLSYSQGDGLSFSADGYKDILSLFKTRLGEGKENTAKLILEYCSLSIQGNKGNYAYASASDIDLSLEYYSREVPNIENIVEKVQSDLQDIYLELCKKLERQGYDEIEYSNSDESISENIIANEYEFTKEGKRI